MYNQIATYFEYIFSRYQCGFCKGYSAQQCLLAMTEKWKKVVDNGAVVGALLTDLTNAFDCIPHDLVIAKWCIWLEAYGFHIDALKLIHDCLSNRKQRVKVNDGYSLWNDIFYGVSQGIHTRSFIIQYTFIWPILFFGRLRHCKLCGWYYNLYGKRKKKESVIRALETSSSMLFGSFNNNFMNANSEKSHVIISCAEAITVMINGLPIDSSKTEVLS